MMNRLLGVLDPGSRPIMHMCSAQKKFSQINLLGFVRKSRIMHRLLQLTRQRVANRSRRARASDNLAS
jgi:hypothetical protein